MRSSRPAFAVALLWTLLASALAHAGPAGTAIGGQINQSLGQVALFCADDPTISCPSDPSAYGTALSMDRLKLEMCDPAKQVACVPRVVAETEGTLALSATETSAPGTCNAGAECINLSINIGLVVPGTFSSVSKNETSSKSGFKRDDFCNQNFASGGVSIGGWFPRRSRNCVFDDGGINFEGLLIPGNTCFDPLCSTDLAGFRTDLLDFAELEYDLPIGSVIPTLFEEQQGAVKLTNPVNDQTIGDTRSAQYPIPIRFAAALRPVPRERLEAVSRWGFGESVAISRDLLAVGARNYSGAGTVDGAVFTYRKQSSSWVSQALIQASDLVPGEDDQFAYDVALDGDLLLVGAFLDDAPNTNQGSAYVFRFDGVQWKQEAKLVALDGAAGDGFGYKVSLYGDTAVVSAIFADVAGRADQGAVYVFRRTGSAWQQEAKLVPDPPGGVADMGFGNSVDVFAQRVLVGAPGQPGGGGAYVFRRNGAAWVQEQVLSAVGSQNLGISVALSADRAFVGAEGASGLPSSAGAIQVYTRLGASWTPETRLQANVPRASEKLGSGLAVSGNTLVAGMSSPSESLIRSGASVFRFDGAGWHQDARLRPESGVTGPYYSAYTVAADAEHVVVGQRENSAGETLVDVYELPSTTIRLSGIATGGVVSVSLPGGAGALTTVQLATSGGQSAATVAAALGNALGQNLSLRAYFVDASGGNDRVVLRRTAPSSVSVSDTDAGLSVALVTECNDSEDNDLDGASDLSDIGCQSPSDLSEKTSIRACDNGLDDDGDGRIDRRHDPGCGNPSDATESPECQDGLDNDGDGSVDFDRGVAALGEGASGLSAAADPQCTFGSSFSERPSSCGLGFELAVVLPLVALLGRTRRRNAALAAA